MQDLQYIPVLMICLVLGMLVACSFLYLSAACKDWNSNRPMSVVRQKLIVWWYLFSVPLCAIAMVLLTSLDEKSFGPDFLILLKALRAIGFVSLMSLPIVLLLQRVSRRQQSESGS